jgi:hypothetical protein
LRAFVPRGLLNTILLECFNQLRGQYTLGRRQCRQPAENVTFREIELLT